jgi:hypothetical protein
VIEEPLDPRYPTVANRIDRREALSHVCAAGGPESAPFAAMHHAAIIDFEKLRRGPPPLARARLWRLLKKGIRPEYPAMRRHRHYAGIGSSNPISACERNQRKETSEPTRASARTTAEQTIAPTKSGREHKLHQVSWSGLLGHGLQYPLETP